MDPELPPGMIWGRWCGEPAVKQIDKNLAMLTEVSGLWEISVWFDDKGWKDYPGSHKLDEAKHILAVIMWTI